MNTRNKAKSPWRGVAAIAALSLGCTLAAYAAVREARLAQTEPPPTDAPAPAPTPETESAPSDTVGAPVDAPEALPPELRESADNNVSFPVDI